MFAIVRGDELRHRVDGSGDDGRVLERDDRTDLSHEGCRRLNRLN